MDDLDDLDDLDETLEPPLALVAFMLGVSDFVLSTLDTFECSDLREGIDLGEVDAGGDLVFDD